MPNIVDPTKIVEDVLEGVDDNIYSRQEWEDNLTVRHLADMKSDNYLSKIIRPIITIWAMAINTVIWLGLLYTPNTVDDTVVYAAAGVLTSAIGFYFYSRSVEKVTAKKAAASVQIEKMRSRFELLEARKEARQARRIERIQTRNEGGK